MIAFLYCRTYPGGDLLKSSYYAGCCSRYLQYRSCSRFYRSLASDMPQNNAVFLFCCDYKMIIISCYFIPPIRKNVLNIDRC